MNYLRNEWFTAHSERIVKKETAGHFRPSNPDMKNGLPLPSFTPDSKPLMQTEGSGDPTKPPIAELAPQGWLETIAHLIGL